MTDFIPARWFTPVAERQIDLVVLHSAETDEMPASAEGVANYFRTTATQASTHSCVDADSRVDCVADHDVAWAAPHANHNGVHLEQAGRARQTRAEWLDDYSRRMIVEQTAPWVVEKCRLYGIPPVFLKADALRAGQRGITTHAEVERAWPSTGHTDPGQNYPMDVLLEEVARIMAPAPKVEPVLAPPWQTVDAAATPDGGVWLLGADGGVAALHTHLFYGSPVGQDYWQGQTAARFAEVPLIAGGYTIVAADGHTYDYGPR